MKVIKIKEIATTTYRNREYPTMDVELKEDEDGVPFTSGFGSESLAAALLDKDDEPVDDEARFIDDCFYAYLPDNVFKMSHLEIAAYIENNID